MDINRHLPGSSDKVSFGLVLQWDHSTGSLQMETKNDGVPNPLILFVIETWLKNLRSDMEKNFTNSFSAFGPR